MTSPAWLALGGLGLLAWAVIRARRWLARRLRGAPAAPVAEVGAAAPEALLHRVELRMEAIEVAQAALAARLETQGPDDAAERRLQAMAGQILGLVRDKNASLDVALAGLDQLRARMRVLEQMGDSAEARALFERLGARFEPLEAARDRAEARLGAIEAGPGPYQEISEQLTRLYAQKDATVETVFARLAPLEAKLGEVEGLLAARDPASTLERFGERLEAARSVQEAAVAALRERVEGRLSALEGAENPYQEISDQLTRLYAQKDAAVETVFARLAPLEAKLSEVEGALAARDPAGALERFSERLEAARSAQESATAALGERVEGRLSALEGVENPFTEISEQLTRLYAQKDATVETVFARLAPLEVKLGEVEEVLASRDPAAALERFGERLEASRAAQEALVAALGARMEVRLEALQGRVSGLESAENPYQEISDQLTRLYAQKDATVETVFARLAPLEAKLGELEGALTSRDPAMALERFGARLEAAQSASAALGERLSALEGVENPYREISEQLTRLYAQKDATVETVFARLAPLEAKLGEVEGMLAARDPAMALERFGERLDGLQGRVSGLEGAENPYQEISDQLTRLYAQKDAAVETVFARLAPLEAKLGEVEGLLAARDPAAALERFAERLEAARAAQEAAAAALDARLGERLEGLQGRISGLEGAENPFTEISEQLTRLYAQKDATVETVFARLAPLEAKLGEVEGLLASRDPAAALERFGERLEALRSAQEAAVAALGERVEGRLSAKLGEVEGLLASRDPAMALERFGERLEGLQGRVSGLEGTENPYREISDQLTRLYAQKDATVEAMIARLAPLEARLEALERAEADGDAAAARAEAQAIATQLIAARAVAEETRLFSDRIALLEASLPRLSHAQALMMQALERQAVPGPAAAAEAPAEATPAAPAPAADAPAEDGLWGLPRVVSVHAG